MSHEEALQVIEEKRPKSLFFFVFITLAVLFGSFMIPGSVAQEKNPWENVVFDPNIPSQELYSDAFQESAPAVVWLEWSPYAFAKAAAFDKPILLNISARWDRNCSRMDEEIFSDPSVAIILNNFFIPIRVDGDERPEIRKAYGGKIWPAIFFLLPDGRSLIWQSESGEQNAVALGYVDADTMKSIAIDAFKYYRNNARKALDLARSALETEAKLMKLKAGVMDREIIEKISSTLKANFDLQHGGFGLQPKFPMPSALEFLLQEYSMEDNPALIEMVSKTIDAIMNSELYDRADGGIFRIAEKSDWSNPAREKLLDRNASFLMNILDAYMLRKDPKLLEYSNSIVSYIDKNLISREGAFYAGQNADFGYAEGYYSAPPEEREILISPAVDKRFFTASNSIAVSAFIRASICLNNASLFVKAKKAADFMLQNMYYPGRGVFHYSNDGEARLIGILEDNALFSQMLLELYQSSGDESYLRKAADVADFIIDNLKDVVGGAYHDSLYHAESPGKLRLPMKSMDNNALAARVMIKLYYLTGKEKYLREATETLKLFSGSYLNYGVLSASYGLACSEFFMQPLKVIIVGKGSDQRTMALIREANIIPDKWIIIKAIDEDKEDISKIGIVRADRPALYFIKEALISAPVTEADKVMTQLEKFKKALMKSKAPEAMRQ